MNVLAINGSPRGEKAMTMNIVRPFLEGVQEAGGTTELLHTKNLRVGHCMGEFICWLKTPGVCHQKDDMEMVLSKVRETDVLVLATPLYVDGMSGPLKNVLDRLIPLVEPGFELRDNHCRHPFREGQRRFKVVLASSCGFWELDNFDVLIEHVKAACKNLSATFSGALVRPHAEVLRRMVKAGEAPADVLEAARDAGRQLVQTGEIRPETLASVSRPLVTRDAYMEIASQIAAIVKH